MSKSFELDELWLNRVKESLNGLAYGIVQIVVHDGQIVQIERTERQRFDAEPYRGQQKPVQQNPSQKRTKP
ncbi:YezD family protein [Paenibacillus sp. MBLB4367]|uniref:YezD family protein n=1 Tax=Paenibacillus sp. MBLB4367 TaxID=3384767 RepID=UPI0039080C2B